MNPIYRILHQLTFEIRNKNLFFRQMLYSFKHEDNNMKTCLFRTLYGYFDFWEIVCKKKGNRIKLIFLINVFGQREGKS